jgi:hypothetical protein
MAFKLLNYKITQLRNEVLMYHYDPNTALEELNEDATLPNPVHVRDMILSTCET